ncbi:MAG: bifunctional DNA-formamidopyrimidine glycosylase/DNA-(apurinic or apyrimidinic site) lyase [Pseudomonadota bacterium]
MPELPEVETITSGLNAILPDRRIEKIWVRRKNLRYDFPANLAALMEGAYFGTIIRRAKYMLIPLVRSDETRYLIAHLGMSGRFVASAPNSPNPQWDTHDHLAVDCIGGYQLIYHDPRRFGFIIDGGNVVWQHKMIAKLGPEPIGKKACDATYLFRQLQVSRATIKTRLLDQGVIAGLGNIYVCEALWHAGIAPTRPSNTITRKETQKLLQAIRAVLHRAIADGGSSLRDYRDAEGQKGYFQTQWAVYGRAGEDCTYKGCRGKIMRMTQAGRSSFYCACHQK